MSKGSRFLAINRKAILGFWTAGGDRRAKFLIWQYWVSINTKVPTHSPRNRKAKNFVFHLWWNFCEFDLRFIYFLPPFSLKTARSFRTTSSTFLTDLAVQSFPDSRISTTKIRNSKKKETHIYMYVERWKMNTLSVKLRKNNFGPNSSFHLNNLKPIAPDWVSVLSQKQRDPHSS